MAPGGWIVAGEDAGAAAAIAAALETASARAIAIASVPLDDEASVARAFDAAASAVPEPAGVVVLVGMDPEGPLAETSLEEWERTIDRRLRQAFLIAQRAVDDFLVSGTPGRVLFVLGWPGTPVGSLEILESALYSLSRSIAREYGRRAITANFVIAGDVNGTLEVIRFLASADSSFVNGELMRVPREH